MIVALARGGFTLAKWAGNHERLLGEDEGGEPKDLAENDSTSILGLVWNPKKDTLTFKMKECECSEDITRRAMASEAPRLYDPNGYLSPKTIMAKILLQDSWREGADWDEPVSEELAEKWRHMRHDLKTVSKIEIPRWLGIEENGELQLHIFCDASKKAYGTVAYARFTRTNGSIVTRLVTSRSRVTPLKVITIPRLELMACTIGSAMGKRIANEMGISVEMTFYWTDSEVATRCKGIHGTQSGRHTGKHASKKLGTC